MKRYALLLLLAATASCHKDAPTPDPFLGHWQGEQTHFYRYDMHGNVTSDSVDNCVFTMDVTRDSITTKSNQSNQRLHYIRKGELITLPQLENVGAPRPSMYYTEYARALTPSSFTLESNFPRWHSTRQTIEYHR